MKRGLVVSLFFCVAIGYAGGLGLYLATRDTAHKIPAGCRNLSAQMMRDDFPAYRSVCVAHYYARACSGGLPVGCTALADLADRDPQPEIRELAHRYKVIP